MPRPQDSMGQRNRVETFDVEVVANPNSSVEAALEEK